MKNYKSVSVDEINSQGIKRECTKLGISELECLGRFFHPEHGDSSDWVIELYRFPGGGLVANTNGDPVWMCDNGFDSIISEYGIEL